MTRFPILALLLGIGMATGAVAQTQGQGRPPWGSFSRTGGNVIGGNFEIVIYGGPGPTGRAAAWRLVRTLHLLDKTFAPGAPTTHPVVSEATNADCPAIDERMDALAKMAAPTIDLPRTRHGVGGILDADNYTLDAPILDADGRAGGGRVHIEAFTGTALSDWVDKTIVALRGCFKPAP